MDIESEKQIQKLSELWHYMMLKINNKDMQAKFCRIKNLNATELGILRIVSKKQNAIIKDIVNGLHVSKSTITSAINRMEKKNLIKRGISSSDKRSYKLILTEEGRLAQKEHEEFERDFYKKIIMAFDTEVERQKFLELMEKLLKNIEF